MLMCKQRNNICQIALGLKPDKHYTLLLLPLLLLLLLLLGKIEIYLIINIVYLLLLP